MDKRKIRLCWLKDDKPGHLTKIRGLIKALSAVSEVTVVECYVRWRPKFMRRVLAFIPIFRKKYPLHYFMKLPHDSTAFDLIVSAGGATELPNARMSKLFDAQNIYLGSLRICDSSEFSLLPRIDGSQDARVMRMTIVPSELSRSKADLEAKRVFPQSLGKTWTVLIGGDGSGISWTVDDWVGLAIGVIRSAHEAGVKLIVTTSRRTGRIGEEALKAKFEASGLLASAVWYGEGLTNQSPSLNAMIGHSELVCVTEDSASMVNEAVASGRPVLTLKPERSTLDSLIEGMLCQLEQAAYIYRVKQLGAVNVRPKTKVWTLLEDDWHSSLGRQILNRLDQMKELECF
jgi:mitochondrial fission protein ELM1